MRNRGPGLRAGVVAGCVGLFVGVVAGTATGFAVAENSRPSPVPITLEAFPVTVLGKERDDLQSRDSWSKSILQRLDNQFRDQVEAYRFAYGGEGATLTYGGDDMALTIVNGQIPHALPTTGDTTAAVVRTVVTRESDRTTCVSEEPSTKQPKPFELSEILDDDSKDVFFWLDEGRTRSRTECILFDAAHNLSLRLSGTGWADNSPRTARALRNELVGIHDELTS